MYICYTFTQLSVFYLIHKRESIRNFVSFLNIYPLESKVCRSFINPYDINSQYHSLHLRRNKLEVILCAKYIKYDKIEKRINKKNENQINIC